MANFTVATLPAPAAGGITQDPFQSEKTAGFEQIRNWIGADHNDLRLTAPVPVTPAPASHVLRLDAPGLHIPHRDRPHHAEVIGYPSAATVHVELRFEGH